jgi:hypothetical protein
VSIGNGQPLVVGSKNLRAGRDEVADRPDPPHGRLRHRQQGHAAAGKRLSGGELGGLLEFRSGTLDRRRIRWAASPSAWPRPSTTSTSSASTAASRARHLHVQAPAYVTAERRQQPTDHRRSRRRRQRPDPAHRQRLQGRVRRQQLQRGTRLSDNKRTKVDPYPADRHPQTIDGVDFAIKGNADAGDNYLVRPTANGAADFKLALTDVARSPPAAPIATSAPIDQQGHRQDQRRQRRQAYLASPLTADAAGDAELRQQQPAPADRLPGRRHGHDDPERHDHDLTPAGSAPFKAAPATAFRRRERDDERRAGERRHLQAIARIPPAPATPATPACWAPADRRTSSTAAARPTSRPLPRPVSAVGNKTREVQGQRQRRRSGLLEAGAGRRQRTSRA